MLQPAEHLRFLCEAAQQLGAGQSRLDDLERDRAAGLLLLGLVDRAHAALADQTNDAVAADRGRQRRRHADRFGKRRPRRRLGAVREGLRVLGRRRQPLAAGRRPGGECGQVLRPGMRVAHAERNVHRGIVNATAGFAGVGKMGGRWPTVGRRRDKAARCDRKSARNGSITPGSGLWVHLLAQSAVITSALVSGRSGFGGCAGMPRVAVDLESALR